MVSPKKKTKKILKIRMKMLKLKIIIKLKKIIISILPIQIIQMKKMVI